MDLPAFPVKLNLFEWITTPPFNETPEYKAVFKELDNIARNAKIRRLIVWPALVAGVLYLYFTGHPVYAVLAGIIGGGICIKLSLENNHYDDVYDVRVPEGAGGGGSSVATIAYKGKQSGGVGRHLAKLAVPHCQKVIGEVANTYFPNAICLRYDKEALYYDEDICAYVSVKNGLLVIYNKQDIKEATIDHIRNEWHLDVFTKFFEWPKISFVLPDGKSTEDAIKNAYAILNP